MPKQGVATTFALGRRYGMILGIVAALELPLELVTSARWKAAVKCSRDKDASRARASQIMPEGAKFWTRVKDHGRAEAALIAWFGAHGR
jgi:crossover junction endodeoxyribonuclease RuvC